MDRVPGRLVRQGCRRRPRSGARAAAIGGALARMDELPEATYVSVNASPATIIDRRLMERISRCDPSRVVVEITEHEATSDYSELVSALQVLRDNGVRVAVDDVGAGFASFAHVLELSPHVIKIDISIIAGLAHDPARRALAAAIVEVAGVIGAAVVAEGLNSTADLVAVSEVGVSHFQGHMFSEPTADPGAREDRSTWSRSARPPGSIGEVTVSEFELAMFHSPIGMALVALDGTFLHVNPALAAMLGRSPKELVKLTFQELTHPDDLDTDLTLPRSVHRGRRNSYRIEKRYLHANGELVWGDLSVVLLRDRDGSLLLRPTSST
ncbi:MAG: EAL domain-containing protein [Microthrixaceae bacterium]